MKYGIIALGYQCADVLNEVLAPWLGRDNFYIALINAKFKDFPLAQTDNTIELMTKAAESNNNIIFVQLDEIEKEHEARNAGLKAIREKFGEMDAYWLVDADEFYDKDNIDRITQFVENRPQIDWFSINFKNYVFDKYHYLEEPFSPPRVFRVNCRNGAKLKEMFWDNDFLFDYNGKDVSYKSLANMTIPKSLVLVKHLSWMSDCRGQAKTQYQLAHFGHSSYKWDESKNCLALNEEFYRLKNLPIPKIIEETTR